MTAQGSSRPRPADSHQRGRRAQPDRRRGFAAAMVLGAFAVGVQAKSPDQMTLAEARRLSPVQLAERLLGAAGVAGGYAEADVHGDGGMMIHTPGLNAIDLYQHPKSAGFVGLCQIEGVHVTFTTSRYDTPGDPPHRVREFWKFTRFAMLAPTAEYVDNTDWQREDRACARLAPVAHRVEPVFFAVMSDKPVDAYFAMRAIMKARGTASASGGSAIGCKSYDKDWPVCIDPVAAVATIPVRQTGPVDVKRCDQSLDWCVTAKWVKSRDGNESREIGLTIRTDATRIDPPADFQVRSIAVEAGTSIDD